VSELLTLDIESIAAGGDGVARHDGLVVFVPRTAPGDRVVARVTTKGRMARGVVERVEPAAERPAAEGERLERHREIERALGGLGVPRLASHGRALGGREQVVHLGAQPGERLRAPMPGGAGGGFDCQAVIMGLVAPLHLLALRRVAEPLCGILADRLVEPVAHGAMVGGRLVGLRQRALA
jgi:predicted RNA-binding protein with TRAM domain